MAPRRKYISLNAYAKHRKEAGLRGHTHQAVMKAVASGRIPTTNGKIDPTLADKAWDSNTREEMPATTKSSKSTAAADEYASLRRQAIGLKLVREKMELDRERGLSMDAAAVRDACQTATRELQIKLLALPTNLLPFMLQHIDGPSAACILQEMEREMERALKEFAGVLPKQTKEQEI